MTQPSSPRDPSRPGWARSPIPTSPPRRIRRHRGRARVDWLAFITVLQVLPPGQRVVLILRDVLAWSAQECADLLDSSVNSVNSAFARARKTVSERDPVTPRARPVEDDETLLMNYVAAFEAYDVERLVRLLTEDASFSMPPLELWLHGVGEIERCWRGPGQICRNSRAPLPPGPTVSPLSRSTTTSAGGGGALCDPRVRHRRRADQRDHSLHGAGRVRRVRSA